MLTYGNYPMETLTFMDALFIEGINTFRIAAFFLSTAKAVLKINSFKHFFLCKEYVEETRIF